MSPRNQEENERIREERREAILAAAASVFARKGLAATKIADIAAAAKMSHGLVYHYFASKEEVFLVLVERALQGTIRLAQWAQQRPGTATAKLRWMVEMMLSAVREQPDTFLVVLQALTSDAVPDEVRSTALRQGESIQAAMVELIRAGQVEGDVAPGDAVQLATIIGSIIQGLAAVVHVYPDGIPGYPDAEHVLRVLSH